MASAARKRLLRSQANEKKGKTTRKYTWNENNRYGGAPKKKVKPPKTKQQFKEQYDKDQATIQELRAQITQLEKENRTLKGEQLVAQAGLAVCGQDEQIRVLRESGARAVKEADKWKARFMVIKERFEQNFSKAAPMQP